jgi:hypothetical protein
MQVPAGQGSVSLRRLLLAGALLLGGSGDLLAQVPCSGNAGGLNERRYSVVPTDISAGPTQVTAIAFDAGHIVITQQVQVVVELMQETHFVALCLHADYLGVGGSRALPTGDLEWRRVSPDPMSGFAVVNRNSPMPVIAQQATGTLVAVYEFRVRLRWQDHAPATYGTSLFWTAYRNRPN